MNFLSGSNEELNQEKNLSFLTILWRSPQCATALIAAITSGSMFMWMEFVEKLSVVIPGILLALMSIRLNRNLKFRFNYGTGKVEAITALCCEIFDLAGLFCVIGFSIRSFFKPSHESDSAIAVILCIAGLALDIFILLSQRSIAHKAHSNRMLHTAFLSAKKEFAFDSIALAALILDTILRNIHGLSYFSPIACLILSVPFLLVIVHHASEAVLELADITADEEYQLKILTILNELSKDFEDYGEIYSRKSGNHVFIDIEISFPADTDYRTIKSVSANIKDRIGKEISNSRINIIII